MNTLLSARKQPQGISGFTLIELLVVVSIIGMLLTGGLTGFNDYNNAQTVKQAALTLRNNMRYAQSKAQAAEADCTGLFLGYQMSFNTSTYTIQAQCQGGNVGTLQTFTLATGLTFSSAPSALLFKPLTQGVGISASQTVTITGRGKTATVTVYPTGEIKYP